VRRRHAGGIDLILDDDGNAVQRADKSGLLATSSLSASSSARGLRLMIELIFGPPLS